MTSAKVFEVLAPVLRSTPGASPSHKGDDYVDARCEPVVDAGSLQASQQHILTYVLGVHDAGIQRPGKL